MPDVGFSHTSKDTAMTTTPPRPPLDPEDCPEELYPFEVDQIEDDLMAEGDNWMERDLDHQLNEET